MAWLACFEKGFSWRRMGVVIQFPTQTLSEKVAFKMVRPLPSEKGLSAWSNWSVERKLGFFQSQWAKDKALHTWWANWGEARSTPHHSECRNVEQGGQARDLKRALLGRQPKFSFKTLYFFVNFCAFIVFFHAYRVNLCIHLVFNNFATQFWFILG